METRSKLSLVATLSVLALLACNNASDTAPAGSGGTVGNGGATASGGTGSGGASGSGGKVGAGGATTSEGGAGSGGKPGSGGATGTGGRTGTGGAPASGGASGAGTGGASETGGALGTGGSGSGGSETDAGRNRDASGARDAGAIASDGPTGSDAGTGSGGSGGGFDPCPTNGDPCKILPLGDSITWGINYGGGYRIKLFTHAATDQKNITFVGYDTANNADATALNKLGTAKDKWVNKHEGHSGWTIQQDDDLVTGKSTATNDGVNYKGKKVVADFNPHIVLVHLGTNDMYQSPTGADQRLGTLIDHIVADAPDALVVVSSIIPFPSGASAVTTFNKAVPGVVKQRTDAGKHVIYVDQFTGFQTSDLGSDQVHPNEGGYEKMAVVWYTAIKSYLH